MTAADHSLLSWKFIRWALLQNSARLVNSLRGR